MEGVSVLHEEPFNEFGETSWAKYTLNKAADLKLREYHFRCIFCFWNGQGIAHGRVSDLIGLYHKSTYYILVTRATRANAWSG